MIYSLLLFELTLILSTEEYDHQVRKIYKAAKKERDQVHRTDFGHTDNRFAARGIKIAYLDNKNRKIKLVVNPKKLLRDNDTYTLWEPTSDNIADLRDALKAMIESYFHSGHTLNSFALTRVDYGVDINVGGRDTPLDYIKVFHGGVGRLKGWSVMKNDNHSKANVFGLMGNTNGIAFRIFGLKGEKGVLRAEIQLTNKSAIRSFCDESDTSKQIKAVAKGSQEIFLDVFTRIVPFGEYRKKGKLVEIINNEVADATMRRKMLRLVDLVPKHKSLYVAQKKSGIRDIDQVMKAFLEIGVAPIPIAKRHNIKKLKNIYDYIFSN